MKIQRCLVMGWWIVSLLIFACGSQDEKIESLIEKLKNPNPAVCLKAERALVKIGTPAVPALIVALDDGIWSGPGTATDALGQIGLPAVPALIETFRKGEKDVHTKAVMALTQIGAPAVPALTETLTETDATVRSWAVFALGKIGTLAVPALMGALSDPDSWVRSRAVWGLVSIGETDPSVVRFLTEALKDEKGLGHDDAVFALKQIGTPEALKAVEAFEKGRGSGQ